MYNTDYLYVGIRFLYGSIVELSPDWFLLGSGMGLICCDNESFFAGRSAAFSLAIA